MNALAALYAVGLFVVAWAAFAIDSARMQAERSVLRPVTSSPDVRLLLFAGIVAAASGGAGIDNRSGTPGWVIVPLVAGLGLAAQLPVLWHKRRWSRRPPRSTR